MKGVRTERPTSTGRGLIKGWPVSLWGFELFPLRTVELIIGFAYTSEITLDWTSAQNAYLLALNLGCDKVTKYCVKYLKKR